MRHLTARETMRSRIELGTEIDDCMWSESDPMLGGGARAYVIEVRAARAIILASAKDATTPGSPRCRLCGSPDLKLSWDGADGGRRCANCGATSYRLLTGV